MTIKHHIILSATITVALIAVIACQQKTQAPQTKEQPKAVTEQTTKVEEITKIAQEANVTKEELGLVNILVNGDFSDGFKNWSKDKDISIVQEEGKNCVELTGVANKLTRIWQTISTTSGHVYRLSFKLKANQKGALCIFRDDDKHKESYFFPGESKEWKIFNKTFNSKKDGNYMIYLSCNDEGKFYYSDISLIDITSK